MERWQNRVAVVTGASAGIGAAIVKDLVKAGLVVVGLARRKGNVEALRDALPTEAQSRLHAVACDVSVADSVNEAFDWIESQLGGVDVLINNAGMYVSGQLLVENLTTLQKMLQTNVMGVAQCTQRAYASMKARNFAGHIVLMNSILGHGMFSTPPGLLPAFSLYPSTKHALTAMTEVLRQELRALDTKIKVTSISPGLVDTELVPNEFKTPAILQPEDVSAAVMYALGTPPHVQVHELIIKPLGDIY